MKFAQIAFALGLALGAVIAVPSAPRAEDAKPPAVTQAAPGIKRTILQKFDVPGTNYETTVMKVEFVPDHVVGAHTHPGPEASYVLDGELTLTLDGQEPKLLQAGATSLFAAGVIHSGKVGPKGVVLLNTYVLEKGKPFITRVDAAGAPIPANPPK